MRKIMAVGIATCVLAVGLRPALAFDYFEHRYLGNEAYRKALEKLPPAFLDALKAVEGTLGFGRKPGDDDELANVLLKDLPFEFGDLSALAGDFTENVDELKSLTFQIAKEDWLQSPDWQRWLSWKDWEDWLRAERLIVATRRQWDSACKWLYRSRGADSGGKNCFKSLDPSFGSNAGRTTQFGSDGYRPPREELADSEMIANYVSLASQNKDHFPRHSWKSYDYFHSKALHFARCYRDKKQCADSKADVLSDGALLVEALLNEAFAQHFLQDSFASGHIGSRYGGCLFGGVLCVPTKQRLQQTHDSLNELGLDVAIDPPEPYVWESRDRPSIEPQKGWKAFGDRHLFIPEADIHRKVVVHTASRSITEVFDRADGSKKEQTDQPCQMCTIRVFPFPKRKFLSSDSSAVLDTDKNHPVGDLVKFKPVFCVAKFCLDERSLDERVPILPVEGWKVSFGYARQSLDRARSGFPREAGLMLKLDYMRSTDPKWPNTYGFEVWNLPNFRTSYLGTVGYSWPREVAPISAALKAKVGWRTEENFTTSNPTDQRRYGVEYSFPSIEFNFEIYRPMTVFVQFNPATAVFFGQSGHVTEGYRKMSMAWGLRFDLSGI